MRSPISEKSSLNPSLQPLSEKTPSDFWKAVRTNIELQHQAPPIKPVPRIGYLPVSLAQERLCFFDQLQPGSSIHNMRAAFKLIGSLNVAVLEKSIKEIVLRHEILRTTFPSVDGQPVQSISSEIDLKLPVVDLRELSETEREVEAQRLAIKEAEQPFDLNQGPLMRVKLLRLAEEEYWFLRTVHHIVFDGWSYGVFMRELAALYEAFSIGKPSPLPELPVQYADFAKSQRQWLRGEVLESLLDYWKQQLNGSIPVLELPIDHPRPTVPNYQGAHQSLVLSKNLTTALKRLSAREGVSLFVTLLAAFKTLLYRYTGQEEIILCSPVAGRNRVEIKRLIGYFNNIVVIRTDLSGNPSFCELMGQVSQVTLEAYKHQDLPFQKLAEFPNLIRTPLNRGMFVLQNTPSQPQELADITLSSLNLDWETTNFDLSLSMHEKGEELTGLFFYKTDIFDDTTIIQMRKHFQTLLETLVANPEQRLEDLSILTPNGKVDCHALPIPNQLKQEPQETFVAPQDQLELQLTKIWEQVLDVQPISIKDNFFDLGGHSLLAVHLFAQIKKALGKNLPLATLFQAATIEELANIIRQKNWLAPWSSLVTIQPNGTNPPLFCMHAAGANVLIYRDLSRHLGLDQPVYGLQARGLDGKLVFDVEFKDTAAYYVSQMRTVQPSGPYLLAGLSSGGIIAWEMAQQLLAQGQEVALLALFDTSGPGYPKLLPLIPRLLSILNWVVLKFIHDLLSIPARLASNLTKLGTKGVLKKLLEKAGIMKRQVDEDERARLLNRQRISSQATDKIKQSLSQMNHLSRWMNTLGFFVLKKFGRLSHARVYAHGLYDDSLNVLPETLKDVQATNSKAVQAYGLKPYSGKVTLFRAQQRPPGIYRDPQLGWDDMAAGGLEVHEVPGAHVTILEEPNVKVLAKKLRSCIDNAGSETCL